MNNRGENRKCFTGETIGYLEVGTEHTYVDQRGRTVIEYDCFCNACKKSVIKTRRNLLQAKWHAENEGTTPSCGCLKYTGFVKHNSKTKENMIGRKFFALTVQEEGPTIEVGKTKKKRRTWKCLCECGRITYVPTGDLVSGNTKSCGCILSFAEKTIADQLDQKGISYIPQYEFPDLLSERGFPLKFDFAIFFNNKLSFLLEYQGEQHYAKNDISYGRQQRMFTDKQKKDYCKEKNIKLFEIKYTENIEDKLNEILLQAHDNTVPSESTDSKV